ncbi:ComEC/Rec2 family competence protein [Scytonema sp. NUACC21]
MIQVSGVIICLFYILGLLLTAVPGGGLWLLVSGIAGAVLSKRQQVSIRQSLRKKNNSQALAQTASGAPEAFLPSKIWLVAGVVGLLASVYFQTRVPQPVKNDISQFVPPENSNNQEQLFIIRGEILSTPRLTRSQRGQFWLQATQLDEVKSESSPSGTSKAVGGKLYVTVPILQATGLHPSQQVAVTGILYKPKPLLNPGGYDFQKFLKQEGAFSGLSGRQLSILDEGDRWGWWKIRERIVRSQVRWLGVPEGPFVSAMVLGSKPVDLPYDIRDNFIKVGLAHALAASGYQTALILGVVLALTSKTKRVTQVLLGTAALLIFLSLAGFLAPVVRAVIMGFAALIGMGLKRQVNQLGSLLVGAVLMLLFNPQWIWDLGFQLSFLATLGLIVSASPINQRLQWLPPTIASLISVPLAATIWTLPLQLYLFSVVPSYGLIVNVLATPLISIISLGGMIGALASLISTDLGSTASGVLYHPTHLLIQMVEFFASLPGKSLAVGSISTGQMLAIYLLISLVWLVRWWQKRWWFATTIALGLVFIPVWHSANTLSRVTLLASGQDPIVVIQNQGKITLINSGDEDAGRFTIVPFLQQQGANKIDWAIASDLQRNSSNSWLEILQDLPIATFYEYSPQAENSMTSLAIQKELQKNKGVYQPLSMGQTVNTDSALVQLLNNELPILQLQVFNQNWLFVGDIEPTQLRQLTTAGGLPRPQVLWCADRLLKELIPALQPQIAIAPTGNLDPKTLSELQQSQTKLFFTGRDGAVQWTPNGQFETFVQVAENKTSTL